MDKNLHNYKDLEQGFHDAFSQWEAEYSPADMQADWSQVAARIPAAPAAGAASGASGTGLGAGKLLSLAGVGATVTTAAVLLYNTYVSPAEPQAYTGDKAVPAAQVLQAQAAPATQQADAAILPAEITSTAVASTSGNNSNTITSVNALPRSRGGKAASASSSPIALSSAAAGNGSATPIVSGSSAAPSNGTAGSGSSAAPSGQNTTAHPEFRLSDSVVCPGQAVVVIPGKGVRDNARIEWGDGSATQGPVRHYYETPGVYKVRVVTPEGDFSRRLMVAEPVKARLEYTPGEDLKVELRANTQNAAEVSWLFEGKGRAMAPLTGSRITQTFPDTGAYFVRMVAVNAAGCGDTVIMPIQVNRLKYPDFKDNIFTPNGDGLNDTWGFDLENENLFEMSVQDAEGRTVFRTDDKNRKWNGTYNNEGNPCPSGTYSYVVRYRMKGETKVHTVNKRFKLER